MAAASAMLAVGLFASPAAAVTTSTTQKPSAGPPTTTVTVTGAGFGAGETGQWDGPLLSAYKL